MQGKTSGFTLFELLLTMTLVAIILSLAAPSFETISTKNRQTAEINALFHAIHLARKESIRRRQVVSICPSIDGKRCHSGTDWSAGWILFNNADKDSPPQVDADEFVVQHHKVDSTFQVSANRGAFTLRATFKRATNGTFVVCDRHGRIPPKALVVSYTGRPRVALKRPNGVPYACAY